MTDRASVPETTVDDLAEGGVADIAGCVLRVDIYEDGNADVWLQDLDGQEVNLRIWDGDADPYMLSEGDWCVFENAEVSTYQGDVELASNSGVLSITPLDGPPEAARADTDGAASQAVVDVDDGPVLALDIETITTVPEDRFDFENSDHLELLCVGLATAPYPGAPSDEQVLFRDGPDTASERALLEDLLETVDEVDSEYLITYKGEFDRTHLVGRAERVGDSELAERVGALFESDTYHDITRGPSLEDVADISETRWDIFEHSLDPVEWRRNHPRWKDDTPVHTVVVTNKDIPYFGERYLELARTTDDPTDADRELAALQELLRHYTTADVAKLSRLLAQDLL